MHQPRSIWEIPGQTVIVAFPRDGASESAAITFPKAPQKNILGNWQKREYNEWVFFRHTQRVFGRGVPARRWLKT